MADQELRERIEVDPKVMDAADVLERTPSVDDFERDTFVAVAEGTNRGTLHG